MIALSPYKILAILALAAVILSLVAAMLRKWGWSR